MSQTGLRTRFKLGFLALAAFVVSGCLSGGGSLTNLPTDEDALVKLKIRLGRIDSRGDANPILNKAASLELKNMVVTFTSNLGDIVRDTVSAAPGAITLSPFLSDSILVDVKLRALRWWNIDIETHDQNDSIVHKGSGGKSFYTKGGRTMDLAIPLLNSRYLMYEARYNLPAEIYAAGLSDTDRVLQKIYFYELVLQIDGDTVRDSSSFNPAITSPGKRFIYADTSKIKNAIGKFFFKPNGTGADTATHVQSYEYVRVGDHAFKMSAYGYLEGDSVGGTKPRLLFQGSSKISVLQTGVPEEQTVVMDWKGPGSKSDSTVVDVPGSQNWTGVSMTVTIGRVKSGSATVGIISEFPEDLKKK